MKLLRFLGIATVATAIGWLIGGIVCLVTIGRLLDEDWDDEEDGILMPHQLVERYFG